MKLDEKDKGIVIYAGNRFTESDASQISSALTSNSVLEILRLGNNPLEASGASKLVISVLPQNSPNLQLKLLDLQNVWVENEILSVLKIIEQDRSSLKIEFAGALGNYKLRGPDTKKIFVRRAQFEAMNTKKKNQRRDFGNFVLGLKDEMVHSETFKQMMKKFKLKLSASLQDELATAFETEGGQVDLATLKKVYSKEYPDAQPPPIPVEPEKKRRRTTKKSLEETKDLKKKVEKATEKSKAMKKPEKNIGKIGLKLKGVKKPEKKTDKIKPKDEIKPEKHLNKMVKKPKDAVKPEKKADKKETKPKDTKKSAKRIANIIKKLMENPKKPKKE